MVCVKQSGENYIIRGFQYVLYIVIFISVKPFLVKKKKNQRIVGQVAHSSKFSPDKSLALYATAI